MIRLENQHLIIVFDKNFSNSEDLHRFISSLLWYQTHISEDFYSNDDNYYIGELIRMMLPEPNQINLDSE